MDPQYGIAYEELYRRHWWWRARERLIAQVLTRFAPDSGWESILDVGCGDGLSFDCLRNFSASVHGVEIDASLVSDDGPHRRTIHVGPFDETYRPPLAFSLITMLDVVEHIENPTVALNTARRVARPNAHLLITVPAFRTLWTSFDDLNHHHTRYTKQTLGRLLRSVGVEVLHQEYFFHWVVPAKLAIRLKERIVDTPSPAVPKVPSRWINNALYGLSRLEQAVPVALRPPVGTSLLAIGQFSSWATPV